jgi:hypothetical protein
MQRISIIYCIISKSAGSRRACEPAETWKPETCLCKKSEQKAEQSLEHTGTLRGRVLGLVENGLFFAFFCLLPVYFGISLVSPLIPVCLL